MSPQESESVPSKQYSAAALVPFDPESESHCARLFAQRVACSWDQDLIEEWKGKVREGNKFLYWIKIRDDLPGKEGLLAKHIARYPNEQEPIVDTAQAQGKSPRTPSSVSFVPIGHVALDLYPDRNERFSLPASTVWIKSLYISWAIQAGGFGRSAMHQLEHLARLPPLRATTMALDTLTRDFQNTPESLAIYRRLRGGGGGEEEEVAPEQQFRSNEDWYARQGYGVVGYVTGMYKWLDRETGREVDVPLVFMKKDLV
ncbi:hypothetical protein BBK36DRAFT_1137420 [Trichoderma citrinoviride]|uniref:N-acetyltransferase domain-containing protein n=1 Tax=Trichoderma citrinoviride TaxID=58853 RepID=A0A2T4BN65_9HYPO|nr:hypothetical protein BBK36DRAFT_1137420 [Trichoderma citrinoviride]PTB70765.1 hypothetical protein BBK36DRAFT_1137420 [Trichoderma citrinoviride]